MVKDLKTYLTENKVEHLHALFKELGIDEPQLLAKLKYSDLEKLGVENLIERRKVFDIISEINQDMNNEETEADEDGFISSLSMEVPQHLGKESVLCSGPTGSGFLRQRDRLEESPGELSISQVSGKRSLFDDPGSMKWMVGASGPNGRERKITVCVRKRPLDGQGTDIVAVNGKNVVVNESKLRVDLRPYNEQHKFAFDHSFDEHKRNVDIYRESVRDVVDYVVGGGFGTILAYGQTGTGKTYTMLKKGTGMIYLAIKDLLTSKKQGTITFCEIYMGQVHDLLDNGKKIQWREVNDVVYLANSKEIEFRTSKEAFEIINKGLSLRKRGVTGANMKSSRSHVVILVNFFDKKMAMSQKLGGFEKKNAGSIIFVDLAGSERGSDRKEVSSDTKNEGAEINKSLLALKECIRGIEKDRKHLPFRQSKLTQILKNSFVGASKTCLIATISPISENIEHTLNTLRYASRIKEGGQNETRSSDVSNSSVLRPQVAGERSRRLSLDVTPEDTRKKDVVEEIRRVLSCIEDTISSLHTAEELERMLGLCKDLKSKMNFRTNGY